MKKFYLILSLFLISLLGFSQATPVEVLRIADATTVIGKNLSVGKQVYNIATNELFIVTTGVVSTATLTTAAASFSIVNGTGVANLSEGTATETTVDVNSSSGTNATLAAASTSRAGLMSKAKFDEVVANNAKVTNVSTSLSVGTVNATTLSITSDGGADDITLTAATTDDAGLLTAAKFDEIVANTAKTGITAGQASAISDNTAKVGITAGQASAISDNTAKVTNVSTDLGIGTRTATTMVVTSSDGNDATLLAANTTQAGLMSDTQFDKLDAIEASADVNFTFFTEKFEEDDGTPTAHTLAHTAQTGGVVVSVNGAILAPSAYTLTSTTLTLTVSVLQYDEVVVAYNY